ncbi:hypothetical protein GCM10027423_37970 [Spirosoma arcticum]
MAGGWITDRGGTGNGLWLTDCPAGAVIGSSPTVAAEPDDPTGKRVRTERADLEST